MSEWVSEWASAIGLATTLMDVNIHEEKGPGTQSNAVYITKSQYVILNDTFFSRSYM